MNPKSLKISIVVSDLAGGGVIRAFLLAQSLRRLGHNSEIVGFLFGKEIFAAAPSGIPVYSVTGEDYPKFFASARKLLRKIDGDIIYALKPKPTSFGISLLKKLKSRSPVILDIDDWELSWYGGDEWRYGPTLKQFYRDVFKKNGALRFPDGPLYVKWTEKLIKYANAVTVDTTFLKERFGGVYLPNGKDTSSFDPNRFDPDEMRARYGLSNYKVLMFPGAARPHKGLEDLLVALDKINQQDLRLVIVGENPYDDYCDKLIEKWRRWIIKLPRFPFEKMPEALSAAHVVVVPQRDTLGARCQFPLKLTDGMAMAKPVLATYVGDIPEILGDTGYLIKPGDSERMASVIKNIFEDYKAAEEKGRRSRERCKKLYSMEVMSNIIKDVIASL